MSDAEGGNGPHIERFSASATGTGWATAVAIDESEWRFSIDEPEEDGGTNTGPNPMHHFVASLAGCQNEQAQVVGEELGIKADDVTLKISVDLNLDGFMGVAQDSEGCFQGVRIDGRVGGASAEQAAELGKRVDARCPVLSLLRSAGVGIETEWVGGDQAVR